MKQPLPITLNLEDSLAVLRLIDRRRAEEGEDNSEHPVPASQESHKIGANVEWTITEAILRSLDEGNL